MMETSGSLLCHGTVGGFQSGSGFVVPHGHAWVESGKLALDNSLGNLITLPIDAYYRMGHVTDVNKYTKQEALKKALETEHYGPWLSEGKGKDSEFEKWSPTQPRDRYGRWSSGGGGGGFAGMPANPAGRDTMERFKVGNEWTPERKELHDKIVASHFEGKIPVDNPVSYMMGGGPASGKSSVIKSGQVEIPNNVIVVDADGIKGMLPEYKARVELNDPKAAGFVHEESSYISKRIQKEASDRSFNTMLDGTGDSSLSGLESKVATMRGKGQKVVAHYVTVPTDVAVSRSMARAEKTGRYVPETFIRECHASVSRVVPQAIERGLFDDFHLWDTSGSKSVHVASAKGSVLEIHDQKMWQSFLDKGKE
jgi:predicted ABC-type ATPase